MADPDKIGIGKISQSETGRGKAQLVQHPKRSAQRSAFLVLDIPKAGIVPTPQSSLTGLEQTEIDALAAGTLVEITPHQLGVSLCSIGAGPLLSELTGKWFDKLTILSKVEGMSKLITTAAMLEVRCQKSNVRSRKSDVRSQKSEVRCQIICPLSSVLCLFYGVTLSAST